MGAVKTEVSDFSMFYTLCHLGWHVAETDLLLHKLQSCLSSECGLIF